MTARFATQRPRQTYRAGTKALDPRYTPVISVAAAFEGHFRPTMVTDESGALAGALADDLAEDLSV